MTDLRVEPSYISDACLTACAGFADVCKGNLQIVSSLKAGPAVIVAIKKLRPYGDRDTRLRVAAVSA